MSRSQNFVGREVQIPVPGAILSGLMHFPVDANGLVVFAHGSGSSRYSQRNQFVARRLQERGLGTLLFDLLTREEEAIDVRTRHLRFDIALLADRLVHAARWASADKDQSGLKIGFFGASTGAAAALIAAAELGPEVAAIVSRGGRPDLADKALQLVYAPTLLIVGGADQVVIELNKQAQTAMRRALTRLEIVPGATHLFEEPGALERVAELASNWFDHYIALGHLRPQMKKSPHQTEEINP